MADFNALALVHRLEKPDWTWIKDTETRTLVDAGKLIQISVTVEASDLTDNVKGSAIVTPLIVAMDTLRKQASNAVIEYKLVSAAREELATKLKLICEEVPKKT